jgi:5-hydroxyisourate hydrolase
MPGRLTTHVLDIAQGHPAAGIEIELWRLGTEKGERTLLKIVRTNADGRTTEPLLVEGEVQPGTFELVFAVDDYFRRQGVATAEPPFLDRVPIRFSIADPNAHYHVPLLVSPWAYSTYRGS